MVKAGEQNKGPFKLAPDVKTLVGPSPEQADRYTTPVTPAASNQPLQCLTKGQAPPRRELRYLFQAKPAPKSLVRFDLTGHPGIKCRTPPSPLHAAHWLANTAARLQLSRPLDKCTSSNYIHSTVWRFIFTATGFYE